VGAAALFVPALINAVASFWSDGVMANFRHDPQAALNWSATVSMLTTSVALALGIAAVAIR
jgi:hypothetical protein